jgi:hypothetical protein
MQDPSLCQILLRFGRRGGTFSPSCFQIHSTRLSLVYSLPVICASAKVQWLIAQNDKLRRAKVLILPHKHCC